MSVVDSPVVSCEREEIGLFHLVQMGQRNEPLGRQE